MKHIFTLVAGLLLAGLTVSGPSAAASSAQLAAHFVTTTCARPCDQPQRADWYFWRSENRVEIRNGASDVGELWQRDGEGRPTLVYLEPKHKRGIAYNASDLRILNRTPRWERLASIVSQDTLNKLRVVGETEVLGEKAQRYSGTIDAHAVEVVWVPDLQVAARVTHRYPDREVTTVLDALLDDRAAVTATTAAELAGFALVDFSDLGDMETNDTMAWLKQAVAAPGHETHAH